MQLQENRRSPWSASCSSLASCRSPPANYWRSSAATAATTRPTAPTSPTSRASPPPSRVPSNASSSPDHFATATAGQAPDAAHALALCRGDVANATACGDCVAASFRDARRTCPSDKSATIYYDDCLVRFAGDDFLAAPDITENATLFQAWNQQNITGDAAVAAANVRELLTVTARTAAAAARRFATGFMDGSSESRQTLYSLAQCTPDLAAGDCLGCLRRLIAMVNSTTSVRLGGRVLLLRCNLRFEAFVFYAGEPTRRVSPPGSTPAPDSIAPIKNSV